MRIVVARPRAALFGVALFLIAGLCLLFLMATSLVAVAWRRPGLVLVALAAWILAAEWDRRSRARAAEGRFAAAALDDAPADVPAVLAELMDVRLATRRGDARA